MSSFDPPNINFARTSAQARARVRAIRRNFTWDKSAVLALLASAAIFAPLAVVVMRQAAQIFAN